MTPANGTLQEIDGRPALRFERALPHSPERVWRALTDPAEQATWHPTPATFEPGLGGRVQFEDSLVEFEDGVVTDFEPPHLLGYTWGKQGPGADHLLWELQPDDGDGCLLILVHTFEDRLKAARDGAGWHICLDNLGATLAGGASSGVPMPGEDRWSELNGDYQERFGISPEEATPPPVRE